MTSRDDFGNDGLPVLTPEGRELLERKSLSLLESLMAFATPGPGESVDDRTLALYEETLGRFIELSHAIHSSTSVESFPDDPKLVALGDDVVISSGIGNIERCLIVHPLEASENAGRVSSDSEVGRALLGRSVGEQVDLGDRVVTILQASRRVIDER